MTVEELKEKDRDFNSSVFISKVNIAVKKIYYAVSLNQLDMCDCFVSDRVLETLKEKIKKAYDIGLRINYNDVNVETEIREISIVDNCYQIDVMCDIKRIKYYTYLNDNSVAKGDPNYSMSVFHRFALRKRIDAQNSRVYSCFGCGANINHNDSGICEHCGRIFDLDKFDYTIEEMY